MSFKHPFNRMLVVYSYLCNFDCAYCMHKDLRKIVGEESRIAEDRLFANYDYLIDNRPVDDFISITYSGGEPLMHWRDFVVKSTNYIRNKSNGSQVKIDMFTNGMLLDREKLEFLRDNEVYTCVSFDGGGQHERSRSESEYNRIMDNIRLAIEILGTDLFSVASTFNGSSIANIAQTQTIIHNLGLKKWSVAIDTLHSYYNLADYETILQELEVVVDRSADGIIVPQTFTRYQNMQDYFDSNHSLIVKPKDIAIGTTMPFIMPYDVAKDFYIGDYIPDEQLIQKHKDRWGSLALGFVGWNDDAVCANCAHEPICKSCQGLTPEAVKFRQEFRNDGAQCMIPYIMQKVVKRYQEGQNGK